MNISSITICRIFIHYVILALGGRFKKKKKKKKDRKT